jgi:hypothetical protein
MSLRLVRALVRLQWLLLKNRLTRSSHRDTVEQVSRWSEVAIVAILAALFIPAALGLTAAGVIGGWSAVRSPDALPTVAAICGLLLAVPLLWMLLRPLALIGSGGTERALLLRLLPIPTALLRNVEVVRATVDPVFLVFVPACVLLPVGVLAGGRPFLAIALLAAGVVYLAFLAFLGNLLTLAVQLLLRGRRRAELVTLVLLVVLSTMGLLPQLFTSSRPRTTAGRLTPPATAMGENESTAFHLPPALRLVPPAAYAFTFLDTARQRWPAAALDFAILIAAAAAAYGLAIPVHRRLTTTPASHGSGAPGTGARDRRLRLPFVRPSTAAVAEAELRALLRTVRGKMAIVYPAMMTALFSVVFTRHGAQAGELHFGPIMLGALAAFLSVVNAGVFACNQFAVQGSGLVLELLLPLRARTLAAGKVIGVGALVAISLGLALVPPAVLFPHAAASTWIALWLAGVAAYAAVTPVAVAVSALFPKVTDLSRIGRAGQPNVASSLIYMSSVALAGSPAAAAIAIAVRLLELPWLAPVFVLVYAGAAVAAARALLPVAERLVVARLENLALVVTGR